MQHLRDENIIVMVRQFDLGDPMVQDKNYDSYVTITKVGYPNERNPSQEFATVELPGQFVEFVFAGYLEFENPSQYYNYDPKMVNGIENVKLNMFVNEMPKYINISHHPRSQYNQLLTLQSFD